MSSRIQPRDQMSDFSLKQKLKVSGAIQALLSVEIRIPW